MPRSKTSKPGTLARREAVAALLDHRDDMLVVTGLGSPTYDVHAAGDRDDNFYLWGAMGGAALVGLGLARRNPTSAFWSSPAMASSSWRLAASPPSPLRARATSPSS
jgi:hypothetical protein